MKSLRELHQAGTFVLVNVHDAGSAALAAAAGAEAVGTTSGGHAYTIGRPDAAGAICRDEAIARVAEICSTVDIPVSADAENGWGHVSGPGEVWVVGAPPIATVTLTPRTDALYLGKLAVDESARGQGLARRLVDWAEQRTLQLGLPAIELQTRIELVDNQRTFVALGFSEIARTAHPGHDRTTSITYRRPVPA